MSQYYPQSVDESISFVDHYSDLTLPSNGSYPHPHQHNHPLDNELDDNNNPLDLIQRPEHACAYCGISNTSCVIKCDICNKWFCNGKTSNGGSHIVTHLVLSKHNQVSLHKNGELGDTNLECYNCGNKNVFVLGFVSAKQDSIVVILCRLPCAQLKDLNWDTDQWQSLIEDKQFLPWVAKIPGDEDLINSTPINHEQILKLESNWRLNKNITLNDLEEEKNVDVIPILMRYNDAYQYQRSFAPLVKLESDYDKSLKESKALEHISVKWSLALNNRHLVSFIFSTFDSSGIKVAVGDEMILRYFGPELNEPWEGKGYIIRLPDSKQESFTLELQPSKTQPPIHITNRFTVEFVWKGTSYERMQDAMKTFALNPKSVSQYLYYKLLGKEVENIEFNINIPKNLSIPGVANLNESQLHAVKTALKSPLTLIQGPPGTGKTITSATIVYHLSKLHKEKVLVCAPSNVAVDHLAFKLNSMGLKVVRMLAKSREDVDSSIKDLCLHEIIKSKAKGELKKLIQLKNELGELSLDDSNSYFNAIRKSENSILKNCDVICCTCVGSQDKRLTNLKFRSVLIDESTQASEPESLIPIVRGAKQVMLVGDHQQLGPVILNKQAGDAGLRQSLFERLIFLGHSPIRLEVQYRMHPCLSEFPSNMFYDGSLQNGITAQDRTIPNSLFPWPIRETPMMFWGVYGREEISQSGTSYLNRVEAMNTERIITKFFKDGVKPSQIGVITPYEGQRAYIVQYMQMNHSLPNKQDYLDIEVVSVDAFQGREKDYIILSCVRANSQQVIGFLRDPRRLNVALTRAKYGCIILGNPKALNRDRLWNYLLTYYRERGCLVEGQLDNLQLSSVQLTRVTSDYEKLSSNKKKNHFTPSENSFDNTSLVSYDGGSAFMNSNREMDPQKWPSLNETYGLDVKTSNNYDAYGRPYNGSESRLNGNSITSVDAVNGSVDIENDIKKLTESFGNQILF